jgi:hypothetical protein
LGSLWRCPRPTPESVREPNDREIRRLLLADAIADIHARSRGTYGCLRILAASATLGNEAIAPLENEAIQTDWLGDFSAGLG